MNNIFNLFHGSEDNDFLAAKIELPYAFRIHNGAEHNTRTIKSEYIVKNGSHHGFGLNALFAHKLYQDLSAPYNTTDAIRAIHSSNLEVLTDNPHNIGAIASGLPKGSDAARILEFAYPGSQYGQFEKSDFAFFVKSNDEKLPKDKPSESLLLIAEIFAILQRCNRIEPSEKLVKKIAAITAAVQQS